MARIDFEAVAPLLRRPPARAAGLRAEAPAVRVRGRRRLCAAGAVGLRQDHAAQHHLGPAAAERGAPGSPLGGLDQTLARATELRASAGLTLVPAINEELAATAVWGSQVEVPGHGRTVDGAIGVWYGKAPGRRPGRRPDPARQHVRRAPGRRGAGAGRRRPELQVLDHPVHQRAHAGRLRAAGALPGHRRGDRPAGPLRDRAVPRVRHVGRHEDHRRRRRRRVHPGRRATAERADHRAGAGVGGRGRGGCASSRCWSRRGRWRPRRSCTGRAGRCCDAFLAANPINAVEVDPPGAWLGVVAGGKAFTDVRQALRDLGLDDDGCRRAGIRLLRLGMIHPLDRGAAARVRRRPGAGAGGRGEDAVRRGRGPGRALRPAGRPGGARLGRRRRARPLVPVAGELTAGALADPLRRVLAGSAGARADPAAPRAAEAGAAARSSAPRTSAPAARTTARRSCPEGAVAGGGIGCHAMVAFTGRPETAVSSITQMGGEGAQWIGQAPFTEAGHMFQNMGDGTFAHSGQLAVQACVAAGVSITYKLLLQPGRGHDRRAGRRGRPGGAGAGHASCWPRASRRSSSAPTSRSATGRCRRCRPGSTCGTGTGWTRRSARWPRSPG